MPRMTLWMVLGLGVVAASAQSDTALGRYGTAGARADSRNEYAAGANPFIRHAPLALFSAGSLAVGAAFYGIRNSMGQGQVQAMVGDKSQMNTAIAAAGTTALVAGLSYLYYAHRDLKRAREAADADEAASVPGATPGTSPRMTWAGGVGLDGSVRLAANFALPRNLGL